jgi:acetyl-CoA C-acetyltransferase
MTQAQHCSYIRGVRLGPIQFSDSLLSDGLTDAFNNVHMGKTGIKLNNFFKFDFVP